MGEIEKASRLFLSIYEELLMKLVTTTTYIGRNGEVEFVRRLEEHLYFETILPEIRQTATIDPLGEGYKITVTRLEHDDIR